MANTIRIKRSTGNTAPSTLDNAELAYVEGIDTLYYGKGTSGDQAASIVIAGGSGAFATLSTAQTITGAKTFSQTISGSINGNAGSATQLQTARNFQISGDISAPTVSFNGSADVNLTATLPNVAVGGTFTRVTFNNKGLVTSGAQASLTDLLGPTATFSFNNQRLTSLANPTMSTDAVTKQYVDDIAQGLQVKAAVRVATVGANITLSGVQTIDGVVLVAGDRVLVKDQTTSATNGIYVVVDPGSWTRATDLDNWAEAIGAYVFVTAGTINANTSWVTQVGAGGTIGVTAMPWAQFSASSSYIAGNGLSLMGTTFAVVNDGATLSVSGAGVRISATYSGQTSISTLGTITAGTWQASPITVSYGGTGMSSFNTNSILKSGTTATGPFQVATPVPAAGGAGDYLNADSVIDGGTF